MEDGHSGFGKAVVLRSGDVPEGILREPRVERDVRAADDAETGASNTSTERRANVDREETVRYVIHKPLPREGRKNPQTLDLD
jgi:hypothetical protein